MLSALNVVPSKYCAPEPPAMPPGFMLTISTHLVRPPSTRNGNRSGHSDTPPTALAGRKSLICVNDFRSAELYSAILRSTAFETAITHLRSGAYQKTFGSRNSPEPMSSTGLPAYRVHVRRRSRL